jgi:hypothetical protein
VRLVPKVLQGTPSGPLDPTYPGKAGDLLAVTHVNGDAVLWFCVRDGMHWRQVVLA